MKYVIVFLLGFEDAAKVQPFARIFGSLQKTVPGFVPPLGLALVECAVADWAVVQKLQVASELPLAQQELFYGSVLYKGFLKVRAVAPFAAEVFGKAVVLAGVSPDDFLKASLFVVKHRSCINLIPNAVARQLLLTFRKLLDIVCAMEQGEVKPPACLMKLSKHVFMDLALLKIGFQGQFQVSEGSRTEVQRRFLAMAKHKLAFELAALHH